MQDTEDEQTEMFETNELDKKVDLIITVDTYVDESKLNLGPDEGLIMCVGSAEFNVELVFLANGTTTKKGTYRLTDYRCPAYGNAQECKVTPMQDSYQERNIGDMTTLFENDNIAFAILDLPVGETIYVEQECMGIPTVVPDAGILVQVILPLQMYLSHLSVIEDTVQPTIREGIELPGNMLANVTIEGMMY